MPSSATLSAAQSDWQVSTMISDKERREVAAKLRERAKKPLGKSMQRMFSDTLGIYTPNNGWWNPEKATAHWTEIVNYLADLIDRPTCRNIYDESKCGACANGFECSECGNVVEDGDGWLVNGTFNYCSECGAEVVE